MEAAYNEILNAELCPGRCCNVSTSSTADPVLAAVVCGKCFMGILMLLALTGGESINCDPFHSVFKQTTLLSVSLQDFLVTHRLQCVGRVGEE